MTIGGWWSQPEGQHSVGLMLMEQFRAALATWQRNVSSLSLWLDVCCERPSEPTAFWSQQGVEKQAEGHLSVEHFSGLVGSPFSLLEYFSEM